MIWIHPAAFLGLVVVPILLAIVFYTVKRRQRMLEGIFSNEMSYRLFKHKSPTLQLVRTVLLILSIISFVCVLAGPRYGQEEQKRHILGRDVFVLFDVSDSMLAEDVSPNRLTLAKLDIEDLLNSVLGDRIGLIAFAGSAQVEIPLTTDYGFYRELLRKVDTNTVRLGGTAIGDAIRLALKRFGSNTDRSRLIILITDGEDHSSLPLVAAENAAEMKIPIITVAIGSPEGAKIPTFDVNGKKNGYKTFDGLDAFSRPDVKTLQEIAHISGGRFFYADSKLDLAQVYKTSIELQNRSEMTEESHVILKDRYQPFLAVGLFAFMCHYFFPTRLSKPNMCFSLTRTGLFLFGISITMVSSSELFAMPQAIQSSSPNLLKEHTSESVFQNNNRQDIRDYNSAMSLATNKNDSLELEAKLEELTKSNVSEVAGRAAFNLGALRFERARNAAKELLDLTPQYNGVSSSKQDDNLTEESAPNADNDVVSSYNQKREERQHRRYEINDTTQKAIVNFFNSTQSQAFKDKSHKSAEVAAFWNNEFKKKERLRELQLRSEALSNPFDRLRWLDKEVSSCLNELQTGSESPDVTFFHDLEKLKNDATDYISDLKAIHSGLVNASHPIKTTATQSTDNTIPNNTQSLPQTDPEGVVILQHSKDAFVLHQEDAIKKIELFDIKNALTEMRHARTQLSLYHDVPTPYANLVCETLQREKKTHEEMLGDDVKTLTSNQITDFIWSRETLKLSVSEIIRKAHMILADVTFSPNEQSQLLDVHHNQQPENSPAVNSEGLSSTMKVPDTIQPVDETDEIVFDPNPLTSSTDLNNQYANLSPEERLIESAKIAVKYERDLQENIDKVKSLALEHNSSTRPQQELVDVQKRIVDVLEEIAHPLQDENQQNQNSGQPNQKTTNDDQDQQDDQNNNSQPQNSSENSSDTKEKQNLEKGGTEQKDSTPEELDSTKESQDDSSKNNNGASQTTDDIQASNTPKDEQPQQPPKRLIEEKPDAQKKADELTRRAMRRQKDAEPQRNAIQQALKRKEKSGKDW